MSITTLLIICAFCTILGFVLIYCLDTTATPPESILEMDYDPEDICIVCGEKCDNYSHWTSGG